MSGTAFQRLAASAAAAIVCASVAVTCSGCGGGADDANATARVKASGKVEIDGKPVPAGTLTFLHTETGNMAVCPIDDGTYASESGDGPNPGNNSVSIDARESEDGNPLWASSWTKRDVQVADGADFTEDFNVPGSEVKPFDPQSVRIDN